MADNEREWLDRNESGHETIEGHYSQDDIERGHEIQVLQDQERWGKPMGDKFDVQAREWRERELCWSPDDEWIGTGKSGLHGSEWRIVKDAAAFDKLLASALRDAAPRIPKELVQEYERAKTAYQQAPTICEMAAIGRWALEHLPKEGE